MLSNGGTRERRGTGSRLFVPLRGADLTQPMRAPTGTAQTISFQDGS